VLEDRLVSAIFTVRTALDVVDPNDGQLSLREAISAADANPGADILVVPAGTYRLALAGADDTNAAGDFDVTGSTLFQGAGAGNTVIDGQRLDRVFDVLGTAPSSIQRRRPARRDRPRHRQRQAPHPHLPHLRHGQTEP